MLPFQHPLHLGRAKRQEFINGSFGSSAARLAQASQWSGRETRTRPCPMDFNKEWQNENCPVMRWYKSQQATKFQSIKHCRDRDPPFYHEFLLLQLDDGSICRVERTGEGSRLDAVRDIGCRAKDYIQWFSATDYAKFEKDKPVDIIADVDFGRKFDILDVLAICYTIQGRSRTRAYTLQRFNCYFLCGTILLVLTRRLADWETSLTPEVWIRSLSHALDQLIHDSRGGATSHLILQVCRHLDPDNSSPANFLFGALRDRLNNLAETYISLTRALTGTLWRSTWEQTMSIALAEHVNAAVAMALESGERCAEAFKWVVYECKQVLQDRVEPFATVNRIVEKKAVGALSKGTAALFHAANEQYRMHQIENPSPIGLDTTISVASHVMGFFFPLQIALHKSDMDEWGFKDILLRNMRGIIAAQRVGTMLARQRLGEIKSRALKSTISVAKTPVETSTTAPDLVVSLNYHMAARSLGETLAELGEKDMLTFSNIAVALHVVLSKSLWDVWLNRSVLELITTCLPNMILEREQILAKVANLEGGGDYRELKTVIGFQEHIHRRIHAHAKRVEAYHIAATPLVSQDIRDAATDIWRNLPEGFTANNGET
ncbi:hypothetical protein FRC09_019346 [Ceratobasidium sp. 395]|nr:hypothetical protein FRC09_019346 [Ceratobasidium sp. 395]